MILETVIPAAIEVICFYLVYYNFNYCAAVEYKESFRVNEYKRSVNGFLLRIFVFFSGIGNMMYKFCRMLSKWMTKEADEVNAPKFVRKYIVRVVDLVIFTTFLFVITKMFEFWNIWLLGDAELTNSSIIDTLIYASSYLRLFMELAEEEFGIWVFVFLLHLSIKFLFYCTIFGFLDCRMKDNLPKKINKLKFSNESIYYNIHGAGLLEIVESTFKKILNILIDTMASCCYRFVGLGGIVTIIVTLFVATLVVSVCILLGVVNVDIESTLISVLPVSSIIGLIEDTILTVVIIKIGQILIVEKLIINKVFRRHADSIYSRANEAGYVAEEVIDNRRENAYVNDTVYEDYGGNDTGTTYSRRESVELDSQELNSVIRGMQDAVKALNIIKQELGESHVVYGICTEMIGVFNKNIDNISDCERRHIVCRLKDKDYKQVSGLVNKFKVSCGQLQQSSVNINKLVKLLDGIVKVFRTGDCRVLSSSHVFGEIVRDLETILSNNNISM